MTNQMMIAPNAKNTDTESKAPVCRSVPLRPVNQHALDELAYCALPDKDSYEQLSAAFRAAPQFSQISPEKLLEQKHSDNLRVILLGDNDYYLRQAAAYLTAFAQHAKGLNPSSDTDDDNEYWSGFDFEDDDLPDELSMTVAMSLLAVSSDALCEALGEATAPAIPMMIAQKQSEKLALSTLNSTGLLIYAKKGPVLSNDIIEQLRQVASTNTLQDTFIAMRPDQMDQDFIEELRFSLGFQVCRVGQADNAYLNRVLLQTADALAIPLDPGVDATSVISLLRRYRGRAFSELDIEQLLRNCSYGHGNTPLTTKDLLVQPYRSQTTQGRDELQAMIGLDGVKDTVSRILASAILEDRRRAKGIDTAPVCRNLAFSGNPGTGKSVTARLVAQIMREEGCGSGHFVEAGREQLIGPYLGQTSPMISNLFQKAQGGVLFIDEAGALITDDGRDSYATEAVNALVRHMELHPETIVIFATYPEEMKRLISSNPGLSSRIAHVIDFPDYEDSTLVDIFRSFARKESLPITRSAPEICRSFFHELRHRKGDNFGNGREARRLYQTAKDELALRTLDTPDADYAISAADLKAAVQRLLDQTQTKGASTIGFRA